MAESDDEIYNRAKKLELERLRVERIKDMAIRDAREEVKKEEQKKNEKIRRRKEEEQTSKERIRKGLIGHLLKNVINEKRRIFVLPETVQRRNRKRRRVFAVKKARVSISVMRWSLALLFISAMIILGLCLLNLEGWISNLIRGSLVVVASFFALSCFSFAVDSFFTTENAILNRFNQRQLRRFNKKPNIQEQKR